MPTQNELFRYYQVLITNEMNTTADKVIHFIPLCK